MSKAYLSRLESADRQPSVATLLALARVLNVPVSVLLGEVEGTAALSIYREDHSARVVNGLTISARSGFAGSRALEAVKIGIEADRPPAPFARHRGEEWVYVLSGTLRLEYGNESHLLRAGQAAHFDASRRHRLGTTGPSTEVLLVAADATNDLRRAHQYSESGSFQQGLTRSPLRASDVLARPKNGRQTEVNTV